MGVAAMTPLKLLIFVVSSVSLCGAQSCDDFSEGLCPLSEDNIIGSTTASDAESCQAACRNNTECNFFSHIGSQCFLLSTCVSTEACPGCMSGPPLPPLPECQASNTMGPTTMPPTTTTEGPTPTTTTMGPTTMPPTTTMPPPTTTTMTTTPEASTTTAPPTTTTLAPCDVTEGFYCDDEVIATIEHIPTRSDCQAICQNHPECNWWSFWAEGGGEHWAECYLLRTCDLPSNHECDHNNQCAYGPPYPDLDNCDDGQEHLPCEDDFIQGVTCSRGENEIAHITHVNSASDCQAVCQNHPECQFFSHSSRHEDCWLHYNCDRYEDHDCKEWEDSCTAGPKYPDMDDCSSPTQNQI